MKALTKIKEFIDKHFLKILLIFIASQALTDIATTITLKLGINITFGILYRGIFLIISILYIIMQKKKSDYILLSMLALIFFYHMFVTYKDYPNNIMTNIVYYIKLFYFPIVLIALKRCLRKKDISKLLLAININISVIGITYILAILTNTSLYSYENAYGLTGWFTSGNELSSTLVLLSLFPLIGFLNTKSLKNKIYYAINCILIIIPLLLTGTKSTFIILLALIIIYFIYFSIILFKKNKLISVLFVIFYIIFFQQFITSGMYQNIPVIKNAYLTIQRQDELREMESYYEGEILSEDKINAHNSVIPNDINDCLASISLKLVMRDGKYHLSFEGYAYPQYFDISHMNFIDKKLMFDDGINTIYVNLEDNYNPYVNSLYDYDSSFSGLEKIVPIEEFEYDKQYAITLIIRIDEITKHYDVTNKIYSLSENITIDGNSMTLTRIEPSKNTTSITPIYTEILNNKFINILLSNRSNRLNDYLINYYSLESFLLGNGYIYNQYRITSFEMDFIDVFITLGVIFTFIYFLKFMSIFIEYVVIVVKSKGKIIFKPNILLYEISLLLSLSMSFVAGHMLINPGPSFFLALIIVMLIEEAKYEKDIKED